jgi:hypothetical protein
MAALAKVEQELIVSVDNKIGMLAEVSGLISDCGINIKAISAYAMLERAIFRLVTSDNEMAKEVLVQEGFKVDEDEVVSVHLPNKVGKAKEIATKIKKAGINLDYIYGSTCGCADCQALMIIGSKQSKKIASAINAQFAARS